MQCQHKVRHRLKMMQGDSSADCQHGISNAAVLQCRVCEITHYSRGHKKNPNTGPFFKNIPPPPPRDPLHTCKAHQAAPRPARCCQVPYEPP
jgi:hypothetical protein